MMPRYCSLDLLPVELLYTLFTYFMAHEILFTFSNISDYIDVALINYSTWNLNLKSIQMLDFNLVCRRIQPEKIISLTLFDDWDTPGQSELFFSRFQLERLTQLQSLTLVDIQLESLENIFSNLHKLQRLNKLSYNNELLRYNYSLRYDDCQSEYARITAILNDSLSTVIPQLRYLQLDNDNILPQVSIANLCHLSLGKCSTNGLRIIFENALQLKSLEISVTADNTDFIFESTLPQLIRLDLTITNMFVSMEMIEQLLSNLSNLEHLFLLLPVVEDVIDGERWQILTRHLKTFCFKFVVESTLNSDDLSSFQTSYWLEEKHWYIKYWNNTVFSLNQITPIDITINQSSFTRAIQPEDTIGDMHINQMNIEEVTGGKLNYFKRVKILEMKCTVSREMITSIVDLTQVKHLSVLKMADLLSFLPMESVIPSVYKLEVTGFVTFNVLEKFRHYQFKQIENLEICIALEENRFILKSLFHLFPNIKSISHVSASCTRKTMIDLINGFPYLLNASFRMANMRVNTKGYLDFYLSSAIINSSRLKENQFTYRIEKFFDLDRSCRANWWIASQPSETLVVTQWPSGLRYIFHRITYFYNQAADTKLDDGILNLTTSILTLRLVFTPQTRSLIVLLTGFHDEINTSTCITAAMLIARVIIDSLVRIAVGYLTQHFHFFTKTKLLLICSICTTLSFLYLW